MRGGRGGWGKGGREGIEKWVKTRSCLSWCWIVLFLWGSGCVFAKTLAPDIETKAGKRKDFADGKIEFFSVHDRFVPLFFWEVG